MAYADTLIEKVRKGKTAVLGLGISNIPLVEFLLSYGAEITVYDRKSKEDIGNIAERLEALGVKFITGENYLDDIKADVIFRSPGIRPDKGSIPNAVKNGAILTSEMELFLELTPANVIAVTGSDGKTTTTTLIYNLLKKEFEKSGRKVFVGGNIGTPLLPYVNEMSKNDFAVLELSSFQLFTMKRSPYRAVITNISPNHLDWHIDMEEYINSKCNVFMHGAEELTTNAENDICRRIAGLVDIKKTFFSSKSSGMDVFKRCKDADTALYINDGYICIGNGNEERKILKTDRILIPGIHNIENYMAAISATRGLVTYETIASVAESFAGVEHRLEFVREYNGVKYYNSSIDSSPTRTEAALSALQVKPIVICGGYDKNIPFAPLAKALCKYAKSVILTGATADKIYTALKEEPMFDAKKIPIRFEKNFDDAVFCAKNTAQSGDTVLLSPACASFDAFVNFEARGNRFKSIVKGF